MTLRLHVRLFLSATLTALFIFLAIGSDFARAAPPEPHSYRLDDYHAPTPDTLQGARVVTVEQAYALWRERGAVFIDVMPKITRPANLPPDVIWRDKPRENIPASVWLPDVGRGALSVQADAYFRRSLARLAVERPGLPFVFYCMTDCWMSWNAAKRAMDEYGYTNVIWFPEGSDTWAFYGWPLERAEPEP
jgi:PQQ-dependent catabolism-associated CXXCW motif protein